MSAASPTCGRPTSPDIRSAISSLESAVGCLLSALQDGETVPCGPAPVPASHSALPASKPATPTSATFGLSGSSSSASADLQRCLASRSQTRLATGGSTEVSLTWKARATPAGRRYCQLAVSARRTSETDCGLWPTPTSLTAAKDGKTGAGNSAGLVAIKKHAEAALRPTPSVASAEGGQSSRSGDRKGEMLLGGLARSLWATPTTRDHRSVMASTDTHERNARPLSEQVGAAVGLWSTPRASDGEKGGPNQSFGAGGTPLPVQVHQVAMWATPQHRAKGGGEYADPAKALARMESGHQVNLQDQVLGLITSGSPAPTENRGGLNPEFVSWLMGFPTAWDACAPTATRLSRKLPPSSSAPFSTRLKRLEWAMNALIEALDP